MSIEKVKIFDFDFISAASLEEVAHLLMRGPLAPAAARHDFLITPNAYTLVQYSEHPELKNFYKKGFITPDGMPVLWMSKLLKRGTLKARLSGSDLFPVIWKMIKEHQQPVSLILPKDSVCTLFNNDYSRCNCFVPDFFDPKDEAYIAKFVDEVADGIIRNGSRFLFLGLTFPKQELLGIRISARLKEKGYQENILFLLLGASFEFYFGLKKRAPVFFQKMGLEWLYRFLSEPRRLWKRYTVDNVKFIKLAMKEYRNKNRLS